MDMQLVALYVSVGLIFIMIFIILGNDKVSISSQLWAAFEALVLVAVVKLSGEWSFNHLGEVGKVTYDVFLIVILAFLVAIFMLQQTKKV